MRESLRKYRFPLLGCLLVVLLSLCFALVVGVAVYLDNRNKDENITEEETSENEELKLLVLNGEVEVEDINGVKTTVTEEQEINIGDKLTTRENTQALVIFEDNSSITLDSNTKIELTKSTIEENTTKTKVKQESGNIWVRIKKLAGFSSEFEAESPNVVASVRGTEFSMDIRENFKLTTEENTVEVFLKNQQDNKISVNQGEGIEYKEGGAFEKKEWSTKDFNPAWSFYNECITNELEKFLEGDLSGNELIDSVSEINCALAEDTTPPSPTPTPTPPPAAVVLTRPTVNISKVGGRSSVSGKVTTNDTQYKNFIVALGSKIAGTDVKNWFTVDKAGNVNITGLSLEHGKTYYLSAITKGLDGTNSPVGYDSFVVNAPPSGDVTLNPPAGMPYWSTNTINGTLSLGNLNTSEVTMRASLYNSGISGGTGYWNGSSWSASPYWFSVAPASSYSYTYPDTPGLTYYVTIKVQVLYKGSVLDEATVSGIIKT